MGLGFQETKLCQEITHVERFRTIEALGTTFPEAAVVIRRDRTASGRWCTGGRLRVLLLRRVTLCSSCSGGGGSELAGWIVAVAGHGAKTLRAKNFYLACLEFFCPDQNTLKEISMPRTDQYTRIKSVKKR